ncbi:MAG: riboflavin synthase [Candidatus Nanopelagicales bacterium]|nr:riboflavin synthase [Candidatus Nanopelagicales bacterium]
MFTGIVEEVGRVETLDAAGDGMRMSIAAQRVLAGTALGDSICVSGVCLTVAAISDTAFVVDVMPETLSRTKLGLLRLGDSVNLERAVTPATRLGGHIVQGHVDGVALVVRRDRSERWDTFRLALPQGTESYLVEKGSVAVDGVSLTVVGIGADHGGHWFSVSLIPTTLAQTTLGGLAVGDKVNLEVDVIAKYVERLAAGLT